MGKVQLFGFMALLTANVAQADAWTGADTRRELGFQALYVYDLQQNLTALKEWQHRKVGSLSPCIVHNNYMGYRTNETGIVNYFLATGLMHWAVSAMLPTEMRARWQWISVGYVASDIGTNWQLGFHVRF